MAVIGSFTSRWRFENGSNRRAAAQVVMEDAVLQTKHRRDTNSDQSDRQNSCDKSFADEIDFGLGEHSSHAKCCDPTLPFPDIKNCPGTIDGRKH